MMTFLKYHPALSCLYAIAIGLAVLWAWFPTEMI